jgi:hypothetical protein
MRQTLNGVRIVGSFSNVVRPRILKARPSGLAGDTVPSVVAKNPTTMSGCDWTNAVEVNADGSAEHCICEKLAVGARVLAWGCPMHALEVYQEYLRDRAHYGGLAGDIAKARLLDLVKIEQMRSGNGV